MPARRRTLVATVLGLALLALVPVGAEAAFPGRPGLIVYHRVNINEGDDTGGLFLHGPRLGRPSKRLTKDPGDSQPAFSADGRRVVFVGNHDPAPQKGDHIYVINVDGGGIKALTSGPSRDGNPAFSPDGKRVVFSRNGPDGSSQLYTVGVDGTGLRQLTKGDFRDDYPTFTPNGRAIVFSSDRDKEGSDDRADIFSIRPNGTTLRQLVDGDGRDVEPDVSPDGRSLVFSSNRPRGQGPNIFVSTLHGKRIRQITHSRRGCSSGACYRSPAWAPDGGHIAFNSVGRYNSDVEVMRPDGSNQKQFADGYKETEGFGKSMSEPDGGPAPR